MSSKYSDRSWFSLLVRDSLYAQISGLFTNANDLCISVFVWSVIPLVKCGASDNLGGSLNALSKSYCTSCVDTEVLSSAFGFLTTQHIVVLIRKSANSFQDSGLRVEKNIVLDGDRNEQNN